MFIDQTVVPVCILLAYIHVSGILSETGQLVTKTVIYLEHWEMFLDHEVEMVDEALTCVDESFGEVEEIAERLLEVIE